MAVPATTFPGGEGINFNNESMDTLLPQPLSPTRPTVSPSFSEKEIPLIILINDFTVQAGKRIKPIRRGY